jgi:hypothetical protein
MADKDKSASTTTDSDDKKEVAKEFVEAFDQLSKKQLKEAGWAKRQMIEHPARSMAAITGVTIVGVEAAKYGLSKAKDHFWGDSPAEQLQAARGGAPIKVPGLRRR